MYHWSANRILTKMRTKQYTECQVKRYRNTMYPDSLIAHVTFMLGAPIDMRLFGNLVLYNRIML